MKQGDGFRKLTNEVIHQGLCNLCGACKVICPQRAITLDLEMPELHTNCLIDCDLCIKVCPQHVSNLDTLISYRNQNKLPRSDIYIGRAADPEILKRVGSGGICSAALSNMLEYEFIDGVAVTQFGGAWPWTAKPILTNNPQEVIKSGCPKYALSSNVELLVSIANSGFKKVVFVGLPCQVEAIVLLKMNSDRLTFNLQQALSAIICTVGICCGNNFRPIGTQRFIESMDIDPTKVKEVGYGMNGGKLCFYLDHDGLRTWAPFAKYLGFLLAGYIAPACRRCKRESSYFGDLSIGGLNQPGLKWSSISVQTVSGLDLFGLCTEYGFIDFLSATDPKAIDVMQNS